jgi:hypothetical protein
MLRFSRLFEVMKQRLLEGAVRLRRGPFGPAAPPPPAASGPWQPMPCLPPGRRRFRELDAPSPSHVYYRAIS